MRSWNHKSFAPPPQKTYFCPCSLGNSRLGVSEREWECVCVRVCPLMARPFSSWQGQWGVGSMPGWRADPIQHMLMWNQNLMTFCHGFSTQVYSSTMATPQLAASAALHTHIPFYLAVWCISHCSNKTFPWKIHLSHQSLSSCKRADSILAFTTRPHHTNVCVCVCVAILFQQQNEETCQDRHVNIDLDQSNP